MVTILVDKTAPPLVERLELGVQVDDDLILSVDAGASQSGDRSRASYFDLEFGIGLTGSTNLGPVDVADTDVWVQNDGLIARANVADKQDPRLIPGDVLHQHNPRAFARIPGPDQVTSEQLTEHL